MPDEVLHIQPRKITDYELFIAKTGGVYVRLRRKHHIIYTVERMLQLVKEGKILRQID